MYLVFWVSQRFLKLEYHSFVQSVFPKLEYHSFVKIVFPDLYKATHCVLIPISITTQFSKRDQRLSLSLPEIVVCRTFLFFFVSHLLDNPKFELGNFPPHTHEVKLYNKTGLTLSGFWPLCDRFLHVFSFCGNGMPWKNFLSPSRHHLLPSLECDLGFHW